MSEQIWIDDFLNICSLPKLDILEYLVNSPEYVDTITISNNLHMQVSEVYQHLKSLEEIGFVKLEKMGQKGQDKRYWKIVDNFELSVKSSDGKLNYQKTIKNKKETPFQNISNNLKKTTESRFGKLNELKDSLRFLEEAVLIALYGNWFITFVDNLTFPFIENMTQTQRYLLMLEGMSVLLLVLTLSLYFLNRRRRSMRLWLLHLASIILILGIEAKLNPLTISIKSYTFDTIGLMFWVLIQWTDDFRERLGL